MRKRAMNMQKKVIATISVALLGMGLAKPAVAQNTSTSPPVSAGTSMHQALEDTEGAAKNAYAGTVTASKDTLITTRVKAALANSKGIRSGAIHVTTTAGVVTLDGQVSSSNIATRAEAIAKNTSGVRGVTNHLRVSSSSSHN
jgi:hypothetical protein